MTSVGNTSALKVSTDQLVRDESFVDEFVCKICQVHVVGCGPQLTKCSHLFCGDCLEQWFAAHPNNQTWAQRAKTNGAVPCPVCKTMLRKESDLYPVEKHGNANSRLLWRMLQALHIKCGNWKGTYGSYIDHLQNGTCGTLEPEASDAPKLEQISISFDEFTKECPPSPSTCTDIDRMPALEDLSPDFVSEEGNVEEEFEGGDVPTADALFIDESLVLKSEECSKMTVVDGTMSVECVQGASPALAPKASSSKEAKVNKGKKKRQQNAKESIAHHGKDIRMHLTPEQEQWNRAYQWRYQVACAQQYQMAVQTLRMQQYYQQHFMSSVQQNIQTLKAQGSM